MSGQTDNDRPFGIWTAASLVVGLMIGVGIYGLPAQLADFGWTGVVAWLVAGAGTLSCVMVLTRLVAARPDESSLMAMCGSVLGEKVGIAISWSYWVSTWCGNATVATVVAQYGSSLVPGFYPTAWQEGLIGSLVLAANSAINLAGTREAGRTQVLLTGLKLLPLAAVLAILVEKALSPHERFAGLPLAPLHAGGINPAVTMAFFAMLGFECAGLVAERVRDPARNVVRATLLGMSATALIYMAVCTGIVMAVPRAELAASNAPLALFVGRAWGGWGASAVALFAGISGLGAVNAQTLLLGEVPLGMARAGQLPRWTAPVNRHGVAALPLVVGNGLAVLLLLGSATGLGTQLLAFLLKLTTAVSIFLYIGICLAALRVGVARGWAIAGTVFCAWVIYGAGLDAGGLGLLLCLAGLPLYWLAMRAEPRSLQSSRP